MSRPTHLTKEDLRQFISCEMKVIHRWSELTSKNDDDAFLKFLTAEGETVGRTARRLFRNLVLINEGFEEAENSTRELLNIPSITLAESAFSWGPWRIRPDIISYDQDTITVHEVKAKTFSVEKHREGSEFLIFTGEIRSAWREILYDLAIQVVILERLFPERKIHGRLILPAEEYEVTEEESLFASSGNEPRVIAEPAEILTRRKESVLRIVNPGKALDLAKDLVIDSMAALELVRAGTTHPETTLRYQCRNCEYRLANGRDPNDGFHRCWGELANPDPHLFDLHQLYQIGGQASFANQQISQGKTKLLSVSNEDLRGSPYEAKQKLQLEGLRTGKEWLSESLAKILPNLEYPLRFLDFETTMAAIPWFENLRPYEVLPIQFSQHTLDESQNLQHEEWLQTGVDNPILPFAQALLSAIGESGHILIYTDYEIRVLRGTVDFLRRSGEGEKEAQSVEELLGSGRIIDQHDLLYRHYHHPLMGGKTSLKNVADAIWRGSAETRSNPWFREWGSKTKSPYQSLPELNIRGKTLRIADGCGAMSGYSELSRGGHSKTDQERIRTAMLRYCELDTLCQVMIHEHWTNRAQ